MKKIGCGLFLIGVAMFIVAFVMFGATIKAATDANRVKAFPMTPGEAVKTGPVTVSTDRLCQVTVKVRMNVTTVDAKKRFDKTEYDASYHFPVTYRVTDAEGIGLPHLSFQALAARGRHGADACPPESGSQPYRLFPGFIPRVGDEHQRTW